jgi:molybdopterin adenylyltransferase
MAMQTLQELGFNEFAYRLVRDEVQEIQAAILELSATCHAVFTTGGTGFAPRDVTPEATAPLLDKRADSLCELMRMRGAAQTEFSHLSRGIAGVCRGALIVNLPGSPKAVLQGIRAIGHLIEPILVNLHQGHCPANEC